MDGTSDAGERCSRGAGVPADRLECPQCTRTAWPNPPVDRVREVIDSAWATGRTSGRPPVAHAALAGDRGADRTGPRRGQRRRARPLPARCSPSPPSASATAILLFTAADDAAEITASTRRWSPRTGSTPSSSPAPTTATGEPRGSKNRHGVPFVTFGRPWGTPRDPATAIGSELPPGPRPATHSLAGDQHSWVDVDGAAGTRAAVDALAADGHRRIAFLGWPSGSGAGDDRRAGWRAGARSTHGLALREGLDVASHDGVAGPASAAGPSKMLDRRPGRGRADSTRSAPVTPSPSARWAHVRESRSAAPGTDVADRRASTTPRPLQRSGLSSVAQPDGGACSGELPAAAGRPGPRGRPGRPVGSARPTAARRRTFVTRANPAAARHPDPGHAAHIQPIPPSRTEEHSMTAITRRATLRRHRRGSARRRGLRQQLQAPAPPPRLRRSRPERRQLTRALRLVGYRGDGEPPGAL